ncbi:MAG: hypothetical protein JNM59_14920 [Hyphomonadaceae bacterium]|nr:hypothetical protein [Hyphomonadaceae bacterium]
MSDVLKFRAPSTPRDQRGLAGLALHHDLHLTLTSSDAWAAVTEALSGVGAEVQSLQIMRQGARYAARCRLTRVSAEEARRLSEALIANGVACFASVEHVMLREPEAAS